MQLHIFLFHKLHRHRHAYTVALHRQLVHTGRKVLCCFQLEDSVMNFSHILYSLVFFFKFPLDLCFIGAKSELAFSFKNLASSEKA